MKPKIAVVEDNMDNRLLVQAILDDEYDISEYESGTEAVNGLGDDIPELILLDISLPGMDGTEVLEWIRSQEQLQKSIPRPMPLASPNSPPRHLAPVRHHLWRSCRRRPADWPDRPPGPCR